MEDKLKIYYDALNLWGLHSQIDMCIEEMSELIKELLKYKRGNFNMEKICEEIADVEITVGQMKMIFNTCQSVEKYTKEKLHRLQERIEKSNDKYKEKQYKHAHDERGWQPK